MTLVADAQRASRAQWMFRVPLGLLFEVLNILKVFIIIADFESTLWIKGEMVETFKVIGDCNLMVTILMITPFKYI